MPLAPVSTPSLSLVGAPARPMPAQAPRVAASRAGARNWIVFMMISVGMGDYNTGNKTAATPPLTETIVTLFPTATTKSLLPTGPHAADRSRHAPSGAAA